MFFVFDKEGLLVVIIGVTLSSAWVALASAIVQISRDEIFIAVPSIAVTPVLAIIAD